MTATTTRPTRTAEEWEQARQERDVQLRTLLDRPVPGLPGSARPVVVHRDLDRDLTYTWHDQSPRPQDLGSRERGYLVSRLSAATGNGVEVAYLNVTHTTPELYASLFPTPFHWADENTGACFGFTFAREKGTEVSPAKAWATAHNHLRWTPPSMAGDHRFVYSASDAPTDPLVLAEELAAVEAEYRSQMRAGLRWLRMPFVDYSHVEEVVTGADGAPMRLRGTGVGRTLYLLAAQHLAATRGTPLRGSSLQSPQAEALWARLVADPTVPTRRTRRTYVHGSHRQTTTFWAVDYTR